MRWLWLLMIIIVVVIAIWAVCSAGMIWLIVSVICGRLSISRRRLPNEVVVVVIVEFVLILLSLWLLLVVLLRICGRSLLVALVIRSKV